MSKTLTVNTVKEGSLTAIDDGFLPPPAGLSAKQGSIPYDRRTGTANKAKTASADLITSQKGLLENIGSLFESPYLAFRDFHDSLADTKLERDEMRAGLRNILTQNEHLRRKDFDRMMQAVLSVQEGREKEVKNLLNECFNEQKKTAGLLRENLDGVRESLARGEALRVREFQALLKDILARQDERKAGVTARLKEFQEEQKALALRLKALLTKGRELRIRDLKAMLSEFKRKRLQTAQGGNAAAGGRSA